MSEIQSNPRHQEVMIRREGEIREDVKVSTVVQEIKQGLLDASDEISGDGVTWYTLGVHPQLSKYFDQVPVSQAHVESPSQRNEAPKRSSQQSSNATPKSKIKMGLAAGAFVWLVYFYAVPYWWIYKFQMAVESSNQARLGEVMDASAVRKNFKEQIHVKLIDALSAQAGKKSNVSVNVSRVRLLTEEKVGDLTTLKSLAGFSQGRKSADSTSTGSVPPVPEASKADPAPEGAGGAEKGPGGWQAMMDIFKHSDVQYASYSKFTETLPWENGLNLKFVYERQGGGWQVTQIQLPEETLNKLTGDIGRSTLSNRSSGKSVAKKSRKVSSAQSKKEEARRIAEEKKQQAELEKQQAIEQQKREAEAKRMADVKSYVDKVKIFDFRVGRGSNPGKDDMKTAVYGTLLNEGDRTLNEVQLTVHFMDKQGNVIKSENYYPVSTTKYSFGRDNDPLQAHRDKDFGFIVESDAPTGWSGKGKVEVTDLLFGKAGKKAARKTPAKSKPKASK